MSRGQPFGEGGKSFTCSALEEENSWHGISVPIVILNRREEGPNGTATRRKLEGNGTGVAKAAPVPFLRDALIKRTAKVEARSHAGDGVRSRLPRCDRNRIATSVRAAANLRLLPDGVVETSEPAAGTVLPPAPRGANCPRYVRKRIAARLPELCEALIDRALAGDLHAAKLLWQMAELDKPAKTAPGGSRTKTAVGFAQKALAEFRAR